MNGLNPVPSGSFRLQTRDTKAPRNFRDDPKILPLTKHSLAFDDLCIAIHLDCSRPPRIYRLQVVYCQSDLSVSILDIVIFPSPQENVLAMTPDPEIFPIKLETNWDNVGLAL